MTVLELIVAMAVLGAMLGIAAPRMPEARLVLWGANQQFLADLRRTRVDALTRGDHFRFDITGPDSYVEYRMKLVGQNWTPWGAPVRSGNLPDGVSFETGVGTRFEFNTRGLLVNTDAALTVVLTDAHTNATRRTTIWPSGQVVPL